MRDKMAVVLGALSLSCVMSGFAAASSLVFREGSRAIPADALASTPADATPSNTAMSLSSVIEAGKATQSSAFKATAANSSALFSSNSDVIYKVSFPASAKAYLNPGDLGGMGEVYSEQFAVANYGNTDIAIRIKSVEMDADTREYFPASPGDAFPEEESEDDFDEESEWDFDEDEEESEKMLLDVDMLWENKSEGQRKLLKVVDGDCGEYVLYLKGAEYDENGKFVSLNEGSSGTFSFNGEIVSGLDSVFDLNKTLEVSFEYDICLWEDLEISEDGEIEEVETEETTEAEEWGDSDVIPLENDL